MERVRVAVLISGRGSNLQALIDAARQPSYPVEIALVLSNKPDVQGLVRARSASLATSVVSHREFADKAAFEKAMQEKLEAAKIQLIALAGFMRVLSADFVQRWQGRLINIHPSLLPAFPGLDTHRRALEAGVKIAGCTVHHVTAELDAGPIVGQAAVPVLPEDTEASLASRVLAAEHLLYPKCLALVAQGKSGAATEGLLINPK